MISTNSTPSSILIVEDERVVAMDMKQTLLELGYDAFAIASSFDETLARVSERCPDLVLMDIRIKGPHDGIYTAEVLKRNFDVPVVFLTAHADEVTIARAKLAEPHGYLLKPVKAAELRSSIEISLFKHQMERRLRERERWFSTTLRSIADAVIAVDIAGQVTFTNSAAETLIGLSGADVIGKPISEILRLMDERSAESCETPLETVLRTMKPVEVHQASLRNHATGSQLWIRDSAAPVLDGRRALGAVMVFRDVTEEKAKLQQRLELADRLASLGTMAAGVAHELNNPLTVITGNAAVVAEDLEQWKDNLLLGEPLQLSEDRLQETCAALRDMQSAAGRMTRIVSDLRWFSRPAYHSSGAVDLRRCVDWAVRTTSHQFQCRAEVRTQFGEVPGVKADEFRLGQVLINLLINAAQAICPGRADENEVVIRTYTDECGNGMVEVRDTGSGIAPEMIPHIFDPFFTTKEVGKGTGLGLSVCHGIVNSFGGEIEVDSEVGKGSTFRVRLAAVPAGTTPGVSAIHQAPHFRQGRILAIDDEEMVLRMIERTLKRAGHEVAGTECVSEALVRIDGGERFDLIFCDLMMPHGTGMEFYEGIIARHPGLAGRIIFMGGGTITPKAVDFLKSVPNPRIEKPFNGQKLLEIIQQFMGEQDESAKH